MQQLLETLVFILSERDSYITSLIPKWRNVIFTSNTSKDGVRYLRTLINLGPSNDFVNFIVYKAFLQNIL